jgi:hypothetical protein
MGWVCGTYKSERGERYTGFWWGILRETNHLEDLGVDGTILMDLKANHKMLRN